MNKEYENVSQTEILGHSPGVSFTADLPDSQEKSLLEGGGLKVVGEVPVEISDDDTKEEPVEQVVEKSDSTLPPASGLGKKEGK